METDPKEAKSVENEFERLGNNLRKAVAEAWQSGERKQLSQDLQSGIEELGETLNRAANEFVNSPSGQKMRTEVENFSRRVQEGEVAEKVESELLSALDRLNRKLEEVIASMASGSGEEGSEGES
jgi:molecular chaperone GrpE (heat shock protein)